MRDGWGRALSSPRGARRAAALGVARGLGREVRALARQGELIARARVSQSATYLRAEPAPERSSAVGAGEGALVLVHGFMAAGPVFGPMQEHLAGRFARTHGEFTYGPLERFEDVARRLAATIAEVDAEIGPDAPLRLVGHSLGGLVCRWYLQELGGAARVDRLVTLATPHAGTRAARFGVGDLALALRPGSEILSRLREGRARASGVAHHAIVAGADRMVTPPSSAAELEDAEVHWIDGLGHNEALFDPRVFELVARALG